LTEISDTLINSLDSLFLLDSTTNGTYVINQVLNVLDQMGSIKNIGRTYLTSIFGVFDKFASQSIDFFDTYSQDKTQKRLGRR
jgi:hypothetical protein